MHSEWGKVGYTRMLGYKGRLNTETKPEKDGAWEIASAVGQPLHRITKKPSPLCPKDHGKPACLGADSIWGGFF